MVSEMTASDSIWSFDINPNSVEVNFKFEIKRLIVN